MSSILNWLPCTPLASGSFGLVSLALNLDDGSLFAAKSAISSSPSALRSLRNELDILGSLHSPFILRCLGANFSSSPTSSQPLLHHIFLEYMDGGSLANILKRAGGKLRDEKLVAYYTCAILQGLEYLHRNGIAHCDIKSHNILIGSSGVKIADFGAARRIGKPSDLDGTLRGTPLWMAPEAMQGVEQGTASDIWSLGCTVVEMLQGRPPWAHINNLAALFLKVGNSQESPSLPGSISAKAKDFLLQCLQRDPKARPTAAELLRHPFLCSLPAEAGTVSTNHDQPSPRSTINFMQSDGESDWEDGSMTLASLSQSTAANTDNGKRAIFEAADRPDLNTGDVGAWGEWMTVRRRERGCCEEIRRVPFCKNMHAPAEAVQARKGAGEVSLESAAFLKRRRKVQVG